MVVPILFFPSIHPDSMFSSDQCLRRIPCLNQVVNMADILGKFVIQSLDKVVALWQICVGPEAR